MECSVCGFSLDGPGHCPACGSENHPQDIDNAILDKVEINSREMENPEKTLAVPLPNQSILGIFRLSNCHSEWRTHR